MNNEENKINKNSSSVIRVYKNKNYTIMSNKHLFEKDLSLKAKGLMSICLALKDDWKYSVAGLMTLSSDGRDSTTNALKALEKEGFLTIEKERDSNGNFKSIYTFYENPEENPAFNNMLAITENPLRQTRCSETEADKPKLLNTKNKKLKSNTKNKKTKDKELKNSFGEFDNVSLTQKEEEKLLSLYRNKSKLDEAIEILSSYKEGSGKAYKSDYAVLTEHNWVFKKVYPNGLKEDAAVSSANGGKYSGCYQ